MISINYATTFNTGYIARTTVRVQGFGNFAPSRDIDHANPRFEIVAGQDYPIAGQFVNKIGRRTGWTYGVMVDTCDDVEDQGWKKICQGKADYGSEVGDSGAPVFLWDGVGSTITLVGIHWGNISPGEDVSVFSTLGGIRQDLGLFTFGAPSAPPPVAGISGPDEVKPGSLCQWNGSASGGSPPYSYAWSGILSGFGSNISGSPSSPGGVLKLTVTDNVGSQDTHNKYVTVTPSAPECGGGGPG